MGYSKNNEGNGFHGGSSKWNRPRHGRREVARYLPIEAIVEVATGTHRMDIIRALTERPMCVSAIAKAVFLNFKATSKALRILEMNALVCASRDKCRRIYKLTEKVRSIREDVMLQITITDDGGHWCVFHFDESGDEKAAVPPPTAFIDGRRHSNQKLPEDLRNP